MIDSRPDDCAFVGEVVPARLQSAGQLRTWDIPRLSNYKIERMHRWSIYDVIPFTPIFLGATSGTSEIHFRSDDLYILQSRTIGFEGILRFPSCSWRTRDKGGGYTYGDINS
jgi:hypothetical protein